MHAKERIRQIGSLGLLLSVVLAANARAQATQEDEQQRIYTEEVLAQITPHWPNPYLSFLPPDADPDWAYWRARMRLEGRRRAAQKAALLRAVPIVDEGEPVDASGWNDDAPSAEPLIGVGTGAGGLREVDVAGTLYAAEPDSIGPFGEDDGALPLANETGLTPGRRVRTSAFIGDGPYGSLGTKTGDFDVYKIADLRAGQVVTIDIDTPEEVSPRLDTKIALYDSTGMIVDQNDNSTPDSPDSFLEVTIPADGDYYALIRGINSSWPSDPFDSGSGPKAGSEGYYSVTIGLDANDVDFYSLDLQEGDIIGINLLDQARQLTLFDPSGAVAMGSDLDGSILYPPRSPLPGGGNAIVAYVIDEAGRYPIRVERGTGAYSLEVRVFRPVLEETPGAFQTLFLDFNGAVLDAEVLFDGHPVAELSPLVSFLDDMGLDATPGGADEQAVIDAVLRVVQENMVRDIEAFGGSTAFRLQLLNSRDHPDPFGTPHISRVIIGGSRDELGLNTVGIAESVDVGNFITEETAVVLLDMLTTPGNPNSLHQLIETETSLVDLLGVAIGNIVSHEAGHLFANFHTGDPDAPSNLMDGSPNLFEFLGTGSDKHFGNADDVDVDFGPAPFNIHEGFIGVQDTRNTISFGLFGPPTPVAIESSEVEVPAGFDLGRPYPNPFNPQTRLALHLDRAQPVHVAVYDMLGRRVRLLFDGLLAAGGPHVFTLEAGGLPSGPYLIRVSGASGRATRPVLLVK